MGFLMEGAGQARVFENVLPVLTSETFKNTKGTGVQVDKHMKQLYGADT